MYAVVKQLENLSEVVEQQMRGDDGIGNGWPSHVCLWLTVIQCCWYLVYMLMYDRKQIWKTGERCRGKNVKGGRLCCALERDLKIESIEMTISCACDDTTCTCTYGTQASEVTLLARSFVGRSVIPRAGAIQDRPLGMTSLPDSATKKSRNWGTCSAGCVWCIPRGGDLVGEPRRPQGLVLPRGSVGMRPSAHSIVYMCICIHACNAQPSRSLARLAVATTWPTQSFLLMHCHCQCRHLVSTWATSVFPDACACMALNFFSFVSHRFCLEKTTHFFSSFFQSCTLHRMNLLTRYNATWLQPMQAVKEKSVTLSKAPAVSPFRIVTVATERNLLGDGHIFNQPPCAGHRITSAEIKVIGHPDYVHRLQNKTISLPPHP